VQPARHSDIIRIPAYMKYMKWMLRLIFCYSELMLFGLGVNMMGLFNV